MKKGMNIEEQLCDTIDKILHKAELLEKKKAKWGISDEETKELIILKLQYMKYYYKLIDDVFVDYIEPFLFTNEIIDLKQEILSKSGWEGNLLFEEKEIDKFLNDVDNFEEVIDLIESVRDEEIEMMKKFEKEDVSPETLELFRLINTGSGTNDTIGNYIELRYNIILSLLEGELVEQIEKSSR
jgi:hypothetical protein